MTTPMRIATVTVAATLLLGRGWAAAQEKHHDHAHDHDHAREHAPPATKPADAHAGHDHAGEVRLTEEAVRQAGIRVAAVTKQRLVATFTAPARVAFDAEAMAHVGSPVSGRVAEVKVRAGDDVRKGDELLVVESAELGQAQSEYLQKRTELAVARAAVEPAKQSHDRARALFDQQQGVALAEVQKREAELKAAEGNALLAQAGADAARSRLSLLGMTEDQVRGLESRGVPDPRLSVRAPIDGTVVEREVTLGELVTPDKSRLMVLADTGTVWVLAEVPEARLGGVVRGSQARVRVAAMPDRPFDGTVAHVSPSLNPDTRTAPRIEVPNPAGDLRPGMFASAVLSAGGAEGEPVLAVPDGAVLTVEGEPSVFVPVPDEPHTFVRRPVKVGKPVGGMVPVLSGLKEGESVVVAGTFILKAESGKREASHEH